MRLHWHTLQCNFNEIEQVFNLLHSLFLNVIFYLTNVQGWTIKLKKINLKVRKEQRIGERLTKITEMTIVKMNYNERRIEKRERRKFFLLFFILIFLLNVWHLRVFFFSKIQPILSVFILFFCFFLKILRSRYHHPPPIQTATTVTTTVKTIQQAAHFVKKKYQNLFFSLTFQNVTENHVSRRGSYRCALVTHVTVKGPTQMILFH